MESFKIVKLKSTVFVDKANNRIVFTNSIGQETIIKIKHCLNVSNHQAAIFRRCVRDRALDSKESISLLFSGLLQASGSGSDDGDENAIFKYLKAIETYELYLSTLQGEWKHLPSDLRFLKQKILSDYASSIKDIQSKRTQNDKSVYEIQNLFCPHSLRRISS